jgi:hypothetical protein
MKNDSIINELPGIAFEKMVAAMQAQIDPTSTVTHNEVIVDRLGHSRQFDVVIRGQLAGQKLFGIIECKDLKRRVGNPEVDAFVTKSRDVNANFKLLMSRSGFTKPALEKCVDYGIEALSLVESDPANKKFFLGTRWTADVRRWGKLTVWLNFLNPDDKVEEIAIKDLKIGGKPLMDGINNVLFEHEKSLVQIEPDSIVGFDVNFNIPQAIEVKPGLEKLCKGIVFHVECQTDKLEYRMGMSADGFFNWNRNEITVPPGGVIVTEGVPTDFSLWSPRSDHNWKASSFLEVHVTSISFKYIDDAIDLDKL